MKYIKIFILFFFVFLCNCQSVISQKTQESTKCFLLLIKDQEKVALYKDENKKTILKFIINDTIQEDYYELEVVDFKQNMFKVKATSTLNQNEIVGWIAAYNVGIKTRPRDFKILLYSNPIYSSKHSSFDEPDENIIEVMALKDKWLKVKIKKVNQLYEGWLPYEYQCSNPYSTCN